MFWDCEGPVDINVPAPGKITISERHEFLRVTDEVNGVLCLSLMCVNVEMEGEEEESDVS